MSMIHYDAMPEQEHVLDEAYLDALEQKVKVPMTFLCNKLDRIRFKKRFLIFAV